MNESKKNADNAILQIIHLMYLIEDLIRGMNMICYQDLQRYYPKALKLINDYKEKVMLNYIKGNLIKGIQEGYYREDLDIEIVARFRMESSLYTFQNDLFPNHTFNNLNVTYQLLAIYLYGIATPKGYNIIKKHLEKNK